MTGGSLTRGVIHSLKLGGIKFSGGDEILYKKFASFPGLPCFLFFSVLTERKLKNQKLRRPGNEAKIVTLGNKIFRKYYCHNNIFKRSKFL